MNLFKIYTERLRGFLRQMTDDGHLPAGLDLSRAVVQPPRGEAHAEMSSNVAMVLAKPAGKNPREIAGMLKEALAGEPQVRGLEVAGPGFLNWNLRPEVWLEALRPIAKAPPMVPAAWVPVSRSMSNMFPPTRPGR